MKVPLNDLRAQHLNLEARMKTAFSNLLEKSDFIDGESIRMFESEFAAFCGAKECAAVSNGTDALMLALKALGLEIGDDVIVPAQSFIATIEPVITLGARPVFVDIAPSNYAIDPTAIVSSITPKTKGIIVVHLYGQIAPMAEIMTIAKSHGLWVIEDCAQAHGAGSNGKTAGTFGDAGVFSFYPGKNLGACGDAGAVISSNSDLIASVKRLRNHGRAHGAKYEHVEIGYNCRMDTIQAEILRIKLLHLNEWNSRRRKIAATYTRAIGSLIKTPSIYVEEGHVFHIYAIEIKNRDHFMTEMKRRGIQTGVHYPVPMHLQPSVEFHFGPMRGFFPNAENSADKVVSLPIYPEMTDEQVEYVISNVLELLSDETHRSLNV